jgi:hypothetical protein
MYNTIIYEIILYKHDVKTDDKHKIILTIYYYRWLKLIHDITPY